MNFENMIKAASEYTKRGWVVHPLSSPKDKGNSPGKKPLLPGWQRFTKTADDIEDYIRKGCNIGLVCGKASGVDALDFDCEIFRDELFRGIDLNTLISGHRDGRRHVLFQHEDDMFSERHLFIGIEYFGNNKDGAGSNLVLPPSVHVSGEEYKWKDQGAPLTKESETLKGHIRALFQQEDELHAYFKKCRRCFTTGSKKYDAKDPRSKGIWERPDDFSVHGKDGRLAVLAIMGELKAAGCPDTLLHIACKRFFGKDYSYETTAEELKGIKPKHPTCETLRTYLNVECDGCKLLPNTKSNVDIKEPQSVDISDVARARAKEILENGDPIAFILDIHQTIHVGDRETAKVLIASIGTQCCLNSDGIHPKGSGKSGKGKSHCFKAMLHLVPKKWKIITTLSDKVIYYMGDELVPGAIIYSDDVALSEGLEGVIKRSTTNFQEGDNHTTLDAQRKKIRLSIPQRFSWWLTSVDDLQSSQLINRQFGVDVDESEEMDKKVLEFQKKLAEEGKEKFPDNEEIEVCRAIIDNIKSQIHRVKIPFARAIIWKYPGNRRNFDIFLDLIRAFSAIRYKQRETDSEGFLIANIEDYQEAATLYDNRAKEQTTKLNKTEYKIVQTISELGECSLNTLQKTTGLSKGRLSQILHGKNGNGGLLEKVDTLMEEDVTQKINDQYYRQKAYTVGNFNPFGNFEKVVSLDMALLSSLSCVPQKKVNADISSQPITKSEVNAEVNAGKKLTADSGNEKVNADIGDLRLPTQTDMSPSNNDLRLPAFTHRLPTEVNADINISRDNSNQRLPENVKRAIDGLSSCFDGMPKPDILDFGVRARDWIAMTGQPITNENIVAVATWIAENITSRKVLPSEVLRYIEHEYKFTPEKEEAR